MSTSNKVPIIGLAGTFASGKDTLAKHLVDSQHYFHVSTSDMVRQEAFKTRGSIERPILHEVADELRRTKGAGALVEIAIVLFESKLREGDDYRGLVVSGLRSLGEAKAIKAAGGKLIFTDAPVEIRYKRMQDRLRDNETQLTLDEFKSQEAKEFEPSGSDDEAFNMRGICDLAVQEGGLIVNNDDLQAFLTRADAVLSTALR